MAKSQKRQQALALLGRNVSQTRVAQILGVNRRTIVRWLKEPEFKAQLLAMRRENLEVALDQVVQSSTVAVANEKTETSQLDSLIAKAIITLEAILGNPESRNSDRLRASELILKLVGSDRVTQSFSEPKSSRGSESPDERSQKIDALLKRRQVLKARLEVLQSHENAL